MAAYNDICRAIRGRQDERAIALIKKNNEGARHWKPIMDAAYVGAPRVVRALLAAGADPDTISGTGHRHTPLVRCLHSQKTFPRTKEHTNVLTVLLERGADPDLPAGTHSFPPLAEACIGGYEKDIGLLLEAGAKKQCPMAVGARRRCERDGLGGQDGAASRRHTGRETRHRRVPDRLRREANVKDRTGKRPLDYARLKARTKLIPILEG